MSLAVAISKALTAPLAIGLFGVLAQPVFTELNLLSASLDPRITFTRASTKSYVGADGLLHTAAVNECPLEYDPVTLQPLGRSFWEARTNLLKYSSAIGNAGGWSLLRDTATLNAAVAPDGSMTASKLVCDGTSDPICSQFLTPGPVLANLTFTFSIWLWTDAAQPKDSQLFIYDQGAAHVGSLPITITTTPKRYTLTYTFPADTTATQMYARFDPPQSPTAGQYLYAWGAQLEQAATPGPYIPTTSAQVTRAADVATVNDLSTLRFNAAKGTLYAEWTSALATQMYAANIFADANNFIAIEQGPPDNNQRGRVRINGAITDMVGAAVSGFRKVALAYANQNHATCVNGAPPITNTTIGVPTGLTTLSIGSYVTGSLQVNGPIKRIRYYPTRLTDAQLQAMTA